jgi:hypothetical protein
MAKRKHKVSVKDIRLAERYRMLQALKKSKAKKAAAAVVPPAKHASWLATRIISFVAPLVGTIVVTKVASDAVNKAKIPGLTGLAALRELGR